MLTTSADTGANFTGGAGADVFNAQLGTIGTATTVVNSLQIFDSIDGAGGINTLNVVLNADATPQALNNIQVINASSVSASILNLTNAASVTTVTNLASSADLTFSNLAATATTLSVLDASAATDTTFAYASTTGTQTVGLTVDGLASNSSSNATVVTIAGIETVNVATSGAASTFTLTADAATTVNITGAQNLTLAGAAVATAINASNFTGTLTTALTVAGALTGGSGNDTLTGGDNVKATITGGAGNDSIVAGAASSAHADSMSGSEGDDSFTFAAGLVANTATAANNDSIDGGVGVDTLVATSAQLAGIDNTAEGAIQSISNIEAITSSDTLVDALTLSKIQAGINTVNLAATAGVTGARTITFDSAVANAALNLGGTLVTDSDTTVTAAGTATTDALTINNTKATAANVFNGGQLVASGYETLTLNGGTLVAAQTLDTLAINSSNGNAATLNLTGANAFTLTDVATNNTGLLTVNASGLTLATGTVFTYADGTFGTGATQSITGGGGNDSIIANNGKAATIVGGAGIDTLTGGSAADSISGGLGNDVIDGGTGNDILKGDEGNDSITAGTGAVSIDGGVGNDTVTVGSTLTSTDTVDGGAGTNTLVISAAVTAATAGVRAVNFEILETSATTQDMSFMTGSTYTGIRETGTALAVSKASTSLNNFYVNQASAITSSIARATDGTADSLTITAELAIAATSALTASNEETVTIAAGTLAADLDLVTMTDLTSLTITAAGTNLSDTSSEAIVIDAQSATLLATVNAAGVTGVKTLNLDLSDSTVNLTYIGGTNVGNATITSGSGNDSITGGTNNDSLIGGTGNDTLNGAAGADTLAGGDGVDSLVASTGVDVMDGGAGIDTLVLSQAAAGTFIATNTADLASTGVAVSAISLASTSAQTLSTGNTIAFSNMENVDASGQLNAGLVMYIVGDASANQIIAGAGNDVVGAASSATTSTGIDTLAGGDGADWVFGSTLADVLFGGNLTTATSGAYAQSTESAITGTNSVFTGLFGGYATFNANVIANANIYEGKAANDVLVATNQKDVFFYQTGNAASTTGSALGTDNIQNFQVGTDSIMVTNYIGGGDNSFYGSQATVNAQNALGTSGQTAWLASTSGWSWTQTTATAGTLSYVGQIGSNATYANISISLTGIQGDGEYVVNDFFFA